MSEFTAITTQAAFDAAVEQRLQQERDTVNKKYEGYMSPADVTKKYEGYISPDDAAAKDAKIKAFERSAQRRRIAEEVGVPSGLADRLQGENDDEIRQDAQRLLGFVNGGDPAPLGSTEPQKMDAQDAGLRKMLKKLKGE